MSIRLLGDEDATALRELRLRALRDEPDPYLSTYAEERDLGVDWFAERLRANRARPPDGVIGAFDGDALVGFIGMWRDAKAKSAHRANLWGLYVAPEARRRGHGRALVVAALQRLRAAAVEQVHLGVATTSAAARRLYAEAGFLVVGVLPRAMKDGDRYLDEELMVCPLAGDG
jgi:ribosomal protein S18 acetylase RimI-like enzyme